jgi:hypothetical protein
MRTSVPLFAGALTLLSLAGREVLANPVRDRDSIGVAKRDVLKRDEGDVLPVPEPTAPPRVGIAERQIEGRELLFLGFFPSFPDHLIVIHRLNTFSSTPFSSLASVDLGDLAGLAKGAAGYISDNPGIVTFAQEHQDLIPVVLGVLAGKEKGQVTAQTSTLPDGSVMTVTNTLAVSVKSSPPGSLGWTRSRSRSHVLTKCYPHSLSRQRQSESMCCLARYSKTATGPTETTFY